MVLIPRRAEGSMVSTGDDETVSIGPITLNGTVLAGTLLVKNEMEWNALKNDPSQLSRLLEVIGIPSPDFANEIF
jgi:sulfate adenylyltransferase (ADP) / ATP adenylyltransferase